MIHNKHRNLKINLINLLFHLKYEFKYFQHIVNNNYH